MIELENRVRMMGGAAGVGKEMYDRLATDQQPTNKRTINDRISDLLRGERVKWWIGDDQAKLDRRQALADVLGEGVEAQDIEIWINERDGAFRFRDYPELGTFDLENDALPPGLPLQVTGRRPMGKSETRTWTLSTGFDDITSLTGQVLRHRRRWRVLTESDFSSEVALPAIGIYVTDSGQAGLNEKVIGARDAGCTCPIIIVRVQVSGVQAASASNKVDLYPDPDPDPDPDQKSDPIYDNIVGGSDDPDDWREAEYDRSNTLKEECDQWFEKRTGEVATHSDSSADGVENIQQYLAARIAPWASDFRSRIDDWLREEIQRPGMPSNDPSISSELLVGIALARLIEGLPKPLPRSRWISFIAKALPDNDEGNPLFSRPQRIFSELEKLGVFVRERSNRWQMRPGHLHQATLHLAVERVMEVNNAQWLGALCLYEEASGAMIQRLVRASLKENWMLVENCLAEGPAKPEGAAAIDACFRALGLTIMARKNPPAKLVKDVWSLQMERVVPRWDNWPKIPQIRIWDEGQSSGLSAIGTWFAAALSISYYLGDTHELKASELNPWRMKPGSLTDSDRLQLEQALSMIGSAFLPDRQNQLRNMPPELHLPSYRLGKQLLDLGVESPNAAFVIQGPALWLKRLEDYKESEEPIKEPFGLDDFDGLKFLLNSTEDSGAETIDDFLVRCWKTVRWRNLERDAAPVEALYALDSTAIKSLWGAIQWKGMEPLAKKIIGCRDAWPYIQPVQWDSWLDTIKQHNELGQAFREAPDIFDKLPAATVLKAIQEHVISPWCHPVRIRLWEKRPDEMRQWLRTISEDDLLVSHQQVDNRPLSGLVHSAPASETSWLLNLIGEWCNNKHQFPGVWGDGEHESPRWLWFYVMQIVDRRDASWRDALVAAQRQEIEELKGRGADSGA